MYPLNYLFPCLNRLSISIGLYYFSFLPLHEQEYDAIMKENDITTYSSSINKSTQKCPSEDIASRPKRPLEVKESVIRHSKIL